MPEPRSLDLAIVQTAIGDYRQDVLELVTEHLGDGVRVFAGDVYFDSSTVTRIRLPNHLVRLRNVFLFGRRLLWQYGNYLVIVRARNAILEFNPRILSVWAILFVRRALGRRTLLWGHAWSRAGSQSRSEIIRGFMRRRADGIIVYTDLQADELRQRMPLGQIFVAPNALYRRADIRSAPIQETDELPHAFVYVGRLVEAKRPELLLKAFTLAGRSLPASALLIYAGAGPERERLERKAEEDGISRRVIFLGHLSNIRDLRRTVYARAIASVSPGYVGLSLIQSLSFGVPMIIADAEPHSPEIAAARAGDNAIFFAAGSDEDLARALCEAWDHRRRLIGNRERIAGWCRDHYSAEIMAAGLLSGLV